MKIKENKLRSLIRKVIVENYLEQEEIELDFNQALNIFNNMSLNDLIKKVDLPEGEISKSLYGYRFKSGDIVTCSGAIPKEEYSYKSNPEEDFYMVVGFSYEEFTDSSYSSPYLRISPSRRDDVIYDIVYLADTSENIHMIILDGQEKITRVNNSLT